jgi:hypothetical protein
MIKFWPNAGSGKMSSETYDSARVWQERQQLMSAKSSGPREIAELNIEHFRKLLQTTRDEEKRKVIARLLAEELDKLAKYSKE